MVYYVSLKKGVRKKTVVDRLQARLVYEYKHNNYRVLVLDLNEIEFSSLESVGRALVSEGKRLYLEIQDCLVLNATLNYKSTQSLPQVNNFIKEFINYNKLPIRWVASHHTSTGLLVLKIFIQTYSESDFKMALSIYEKIKESDYFTEVVLY